MPPRVRAIAEGAEQELTDLCRPALAFGAAREQGKALRRRLAVPEDAPFASAATDGVGAVGFVITLGEAVDHRIAELVGDQPAYGFSMDAIASGMAERLAWLAHTRIVLEARRRELTCSDRFSPGYCGWPLAGQMSLLARCGALRIGVTLSTTSLMTPRKSVSALVGLRREEGGPATRLRGICGRCDDRATCGYRRGDPSPTLARLAAAAGELAPVGAN